MLKFFQKIRRRLLADGNLKRYLIYAVGEIILIVTGILLALQINNWNEANKSNRKEQIFLQKLHEELISNASILKKDIAYNEQMIDRIEYILQHFHNDLTCSDSFAHLLPMMTWTYQLTLVSSAFESLKSSGFDIIKSNQLKLKIIALFDHEYSSATQWINELSIEKHREFRAVFIGFPRGDIAHNYEVILADDRLYNLLVTYKGWKEALGNRVTILLNNTNQLRALVQDELQ
jgi:hypothetical protein